MLKIWSHALLGLGYRCMKKKFKKKVVFRKKKSLWLYHDFSSIFRVYHSISRKLEDTDWIWKKPHVEGVFLRVVLFKKSKSVHWLPRNESVNGRYMTRIPCAHVIILLILLYIQGDPWLTGSLAGWLTHWLGKLRNHWTDCDDFWYVNYILVWEVTPRVIFQKSQKLATLHTIL